jgi:hypothetical protein
MQPTSTSIRRCVRSLSQVFCPAFWCRSSEVFSTSLLQALTDLDSGGARELDPES